MQRNFSECCYDIIIKASEAEIFLRIKLIDYIIDGITDFQFKIMRERRIFLQHQLLQAFQKISLRLEAKHFKKWDDKMGLETKTSRAKQEDRNDYVPKNARFNFNKFGHLKIANTLNKSEDFVINVES